jgi:methionine-rich copper-binding protein CopC
MSFISTHVSRLLRKGLLGGLVLWLALVAGVYIAAAHSEVVESNPADGASLDQPPEQVSLTFTEELDTSGSNLAVFDQNGQQVSYGGLDLNDLDHTRMVVSLPASLANGAYTVRWTAVSADDGDATNGEIRFSVGGAVPLASGVPAALLLVLGLLAIGAVAAGAIYIGRKRAVREKEMVVG